MSRPVEEIIAERTAAREAEHAAKLEADRIAAMIHDAGKLTPAGRASVIDAIAAIDRPAGDA